jgi:superfamily I DNA and/or RNA helicase
LNKAARCEPHGARVGVTAASHKVIANLLETVLDVAQNSGNSVECVRKVSDASPQPGRITEYKKNEDIDDIVQATSRTVVGGTPFLWARPELHEKLDVLFVDEAGQMSLANVLAASQCARSLVLLGDPQQLEQPQQGSHPTGADLSALEHILKEHPTIPPERGIFLPETWRLPPSICAFTSEVFYEGKLHSKSGLEQRELRNTELIDGTGLWVLPVAHEGNQNCSPEEVDAIEFLIDRLLGVRGVWIEREGVVEPITPAHILIVAPYNSQVALLADRLGSRAQCACILVANPRLFAPECKTPRQMKLANALCRYVEMADTLSAVPV